MTRHRVRKVLMTMSGAGLGLLLASQDAQAFSLGIPLDGFLGTLETSMVGLGIPVGLAGGISFVIAKFDQTYGPMLSGYIPYFLAAGVLGGLGIILGALGLVSGAVVPG